MTDSDSATITVEAAAEILGISRNSAYQAIKRGEIPSLRLGKRIVIPRAAFERMFDNSMSANPEPGPRANGMRSKRNYFTFRMRDNLKDRLQAAADENGRSLSEEMEFRLELSVLR